MLEFTIPLEKDELLNNVPGQYMVENSISIKNLPQAVDEAKSAISKDGAAFILKHFDTFFSFLIHGKRIELGVTIRAFDRLIKGLELFIQKLGQYKDFNQLSMEEKNEYRNICKMLAYLTSNIIINVTNQICNADDNNIANIGRKKKAVKKGENEEEWEVRRQKIFLLYYHLIQFPLQQFWHPPIVENSLVTCITQACYKVLEVMKDSGLKQLGETIFEVLGTFIQKYNYGITCVIHVIQLVKTYENLAVPMSHGIIYMVTKCGCKGLIEKIIQEISNTDIEETNAKNISVFLETLASQPKQLLPVLEDLTDLASDYNYQVRNSIIEIIANVIQDSLSGENLNEEEKAQRDMCLELLFEHILDSNAYTRSKILHVWHRLCCEGAVPLARQGKLLKCVSARLEDKSALVRKQALQLLRALLQGNPYAAKMNKETILKQLETAEEKLAEILSSVVAESGPGADVRFELWDTQGPKIASTIRQIIEDEENQEDLNENIEINEETFEQIRQLMLKGKIKKAVTLTNHISREVYNIKGMKNIDHDSHEKGLLALLYKIFIDSENVKSLDMKKNVEENPLNERKCQMQSDKIKVAKQLVTYLKECYEYADELEKCLPLAEHLLFSVTVGDAVESCTFLGTAYQFHVKGAEKGFRQALFQVFYRDPSVSKNVALVYRDVYLSKEPNHTERQSALISVSKLLELLKGLEGNQVKALSTMMMLWRKNNDLDNEIIKVLWETFALKIPDTTPENSRGALLLLILVAKSEPAIIIENLDALIKVGFGPRSEEDLLLARDTCKALLRIHQTGNDNQIGPLRYPNDHEIFVKISKMLLDNCYTMEDRSFVSFAIDAVNAIYHLADCPEELISQILMKLTKQFTDNDKSTVPRHSLRNILTLVGHIGIREMVHMDIDVYKELKRRNAISNAKKQNEQNKTETGRLSSASIVSTASASISLRHKEAHNTTEVEESGEENGLEGASADDADAEFIHNQLETEVLNERFMLSKFVPLIVEVCQNQDKYNDEEVQAAAALALSKFMTISSHFCKQYLQLLVTMLEKSPYPGIRSNIIIGLADLMGRFPNVVEPWNSFIYGRLHDSIDAVRMTCVKMLSNLIMREMIRVKGQVAELALCIMDKNDDIRNYTKQFFRDLSLKANSLYNIMPDIISCLTNPERNIEADKFEEVIKFILALLQKEKHIDSVIEKICARFQLATTENQIENLSFCLSLLQFNVKSFKNLIEFVPKMKEIIHHKAVYRAMCNIITQGKKKPETTQPATELEEKINELLDMPENAELLADRMAMPPPTAPPKRGRKPRKKKTQESDEDEDSDDDESANNKRSQKTKKKQNDSSSGSDSEPESRQKKLKRPSKSKGRTQSKRADSDSDSDERQKTQTPRTSRRNAKKVQSDSDSDEEAQRRKPNSNSGSDSDSKSNQGKLKKVGKGSSSSKSKPTQSGSDSDERQSKLPRKKGLSERNKETSNSKKGRSTRSSNRLSLSSPATRTKRAKK